MSYDPLCQSDGILIRAVEIRTQFQGLKALVDAIPARPPGSVGPVGEVSQQGLIDERINHARNPTAVSPLFLVASDPPPQAEFQQLVDKVNELLTVLTRQP